MNNKSLELLTEDRDNLKEEIYYVSLLKCELIKYNNLDNLISNGFRISKIDNGYLLEGDDFLLIIRTEGNMIVDYEFKR